MKNLIILLVALVSFNLTAQKSETRELNAFDSFDVSAGIIVNLIPADEHYADVDVKGTDLDDVITKVKGNHLDISWKSNNWGWKSREATVTVYYVSLNGIDASSGSIVNAKNMQTSSMDIESSSGAIINLEIDCNDLDIDISSGTIVNLTGTAKNLEVDASSGSICEGLELKTNDADIDGSSGAIVKVDVCDNLEAEVSSGAIVKYQGNPSRTDLDAGEWSGGIIKRID